MDITARQKLFTILIIAFAGLGGVLYGYDIGIIAGALLFIKKEIILSPGQISILVAAVLGGGSIATLVSGPLSDWLGRRTMITVAAITFIVGILILVSSHTFAGILTGRLIEGIGVGIITIIIPLYLAEAAPAAIRGSSVTAFQLFLTGGILLAYVVALLFERTGSWRYMFLCSLIPAVLLFIGSFFIIESPRWLFLKGKINKAETALKKSRSHQESEHDIHMMTKLKAAAKQQPALIKVIFKKRYIVPFSIAFVVAVLTQLTGINVFLQLCTIILQHSGLHSNVTAMLGSVGIGLTNFVVTLIAMILVDKVGRKPLLIIGTVGIVLSLFFLGAISHFLVPGMLQGYLTAIGFVGFIIFFAVGPGVVVWLVLSELMPTAIRSSGMAICLFANCLASAILASVFLGLVQKIGYMGVFWMCGGFTVIYMLIAIFWLPETKNKSLEEIEEFFLHKTEEQQ